MTSEKRKTQAAYLNALAVAVLTIFTSAALAGVVPWWALGPAVGASFALHVAALRAFE